MDVEDKVKMLAQVRPELTEQPPSFHPELLICYGLPLSAVIFFATMLTREDWISLLTMVAQILAMFVFLGLLFSFITSKR